MKALKVILVEDELGAANNFKQLLAEVATQVEVVQHLTGMEETVEWLALNPSPERAFFDIQLEDGLSFEIFKQTSIDFPVIFTTAFDQYAIDAFKVNSVDYLLKPIQEEALKHSLSQFKKLQKPAMPNEVIDSILNKMTGQKSTSFLVHYRDKLVPVLATDICCFYIEEGLVHGRSFKGDMYPIEHSLDELEAMLDSHQFFRANRQCIVARAGIKDIDFYFNGRLSLNLVFQPKELVLISKARVPVFKAWMKNV